MQYDLNFDIGSLFFFALTIFFYLRGRRTGDLQDRIFGLLLLLGAVALVFDLAAASAERNAQAYPIWLLYAFNMLFLFGMQSCLVGMLAYSAASAGILHRVRPAVRVLCILPYAAVLLLLLLSPFCSFGICHIGADHIYHHGPTHIALYINTGLYVLASLGVLALNYRRTPPVRRNIILIFVGLLFAAVLLQMRFPNYLLTASATALSLTSVYYSLYAPEDRINPFTGALSRMMLPALLNEQDERAQPYTMLLFSLHNFDDLIQVYGGGTGDDILKRCAAWLLARFPKDAVFYMDASEFVVLQNGRMTPETLRERAARIPLSMELREAAIPLDVRVGAVPDEGDGAEVNMAVADYMLRQMRLEENGAPLYADAAYKADCRAAVRLESALGTLLADESALRVRTRRTVNALGDYAGEDVCLTPTGAEGGFSDRRLFAAAGRAGHIWSYYERLLGALSARREEFDAQRRLCLPFSPAAFIQEDAVERLLTLIENAGFTPAQIRLFLPEAEAAAMPALHAPLRAIQAQGCGVRLDGFAAGYTDLSLLSKLPIDAVRLDESLLRAAAQGPRERALLQGIVRILRGLNIGVLCGGIDAPADAVLAVQAGVEALQGEGLEERWKLGGR